MFVDDRVVKNVLFIISIFEFPFFYFILLMNFALAKDNEMSDSVLFVICYSLYYV